MKRLVLGAIKIYQQTRFLRAPACRFYPSCSNYTSSAIDQHGLIAGSILGIVRLLKCQPFHPGGIDEVPPELSALQ